MLLFIVFGTRGIKSTIKSGEFNCPQCEQIQPYRHRKVRKFFTLYFIPLIPLGSAGEYVECKACRGTFIPRVLDQGVTKAQEFMAIYLMAIKHALALIMLADGEIDPNEMKMVLMLVNKFGHNDITMKELELYVEKVKRGSQDITKYLKEVTPSLNDQGKKSIIDSALFVAGADGHVDKSELDMISKMGQTMEMKASELKSQIKDFLDKMPKT